MKTIKTMENLNTVNKPDVMNVDTFSFYKYQRTVSPEENIYYCRKIRAFTLFSVFLFNEELRSVPGSFVL
jgi:hypothetical protein